MLTKWPLIDMSLLLCSITASSSSSSASHITSNSL